MSRRRCSPIARCKSYRSGRAILIVGALAVLVAVRYWQRSSDRLPPENLGEATYRVERIVDGDTLLLANQARIRLQGIDTPESVKPNHPVEPFGPEASEFTRRFVAEGGGRVRLQFDRERVDKYGRFLAYVWVDDRMLNEELLRAGLATAETGFRYSKAMKDRFRRAEDEAKAAGRGIWSRPTAPAGNL
ncbi:MAG: thermonuclease family protein [Planctomycetota bacterium]